MASRSTPQTITLALALAFAGCTGAIDGGKSTDPGGGNTDPGGGSGGMTGGGGNKDPLPPLDDKGGPDRSTPACKTIKPGLSPLRRLTRSEYDRTVRDLLGDTRRLAKAFPQDEI